MADYKRLGDYIREVNVRNRDLKVTALVELTIDKAFIPSVANVIGTDLSNYKIIRKEQFACSLMQVSRDGKMPIAMFEEDEAIMSPAYPMFEVIDKSVLMPQYLMMWFSRSEFDREASYYAVGGVRGSLTWEDFSNMRLPIPSIDRQREIVAEYETLTRRIRFNGQMIQKLEATAQALYHKMFVDGIDKDNLPEGWRTGQISDFGKVITGKTPSSNNPEDFGDKMPFVTPGDFVGYSKFAIGAERWLSDSGIKRLKGKVLPTGSLIVTCIGSDMGKVAIVSEECITNQQLNSVIFDHKEYSDNLFYTLLGMAKELKAMALGSSTIPLLNKSDFESISVVCPKHSILKEFEDLIRPVNEKLLVCTKEIKILKELKSLLLIKLSSKL